MNNDVTMTFDTMNQSTAASSSPGLTSGPEARPRPVGTGASAGSEPSRPRPSMAVERWLMRQALAACGNPAVRIVLWDGEAIATSDELPVGNIVIHDPATLRRLITDPRIAFGEAYSDGTVEIQGPLVEVLSSIGLGTIRGSTTSLLGRFLNRNRRERSHTLAASRDSVHHHYDIGNDFYKLWLDERMQYTCAYYAEPAFTLEEAQLGKLDHVCRKLQLRPGERVLEAGCGWGGLALHMAERYGVSVRAFNLSQEQVAYARDRARADGLAQRIEFIQDDYRSATGTYDAFVSVGMLEHVGRENYAELGRVLDRTLTAAGRGLIHSIGRNTPRPLDPWITKRIFPGAYAPALSEMMQIFEPFGMSVLDIENIRLHYARTLEHWLERFERNVSRVAEMFDNRFVRMWRMYLAGSVAAFKTGSLQLFQIVFARELNNDVPWTRRHMYPSQ
jgi:cyclopropane-fatty-acyl-phospholipid synthase